MKAKRHEALAAVLLTGAVIFAGASFAAGAADPAAVVPSSTLSNSPSMPGPADAAAQTDGGPTAAAPRNEEAHAAPGGDETAASLGTRSTDTKHMSRRQAERTEKKITQELNRAAAQGIAQADAGQLSNSRNQIGRP